MVDFNVNDYNNLHSVAEAEARFEEQLACVGLTRGQLFSHLAPLFLESPYAGHYAACLIHRHYSLNTGERMVTTGLSAKPSTDTSTKIVAELWSSTGEEIEHRFTDDPTSLPPRPPVDFLAKYKSILNSYGIDILGVCYAPGELADGFMFSESDGLEDQERVNAVIHRSAKSDKCYDVKWLATRNADGLSWTLIAAGCCTSPAC